MRIFNRSRLAGAVAASAMVAAGLTVGAVPASAAQGELASQALDELAVKPAASTNGYDRDDFGSGWTDTDGNGCDTRNDTLAHDLVNETFDPGSDCEIATGPLPYEPYTGMKNFQFVADGSYEQGLDTEHIVALSNAWTTGAQSWSQGKREKFANDPLEVMMTDSSQNRSKGDASADEWLPPNAAYQCGYVATQIRIKGEYGLWVTPAEHDAMKQVLDACPTQRVPAGSDPVINPPTNGVTTWAGETPDDAPDGGESIDQDETTEGGDGATGDPSAEDGEPAGGDGSGEAAAPEGDVASPGSDATTDPEVPSVVQTDGGAVIDQEPSGAYAAVALLSTMLAGGAVLMLLRPRRG